MPRIGIIKKSGLIVLTALLLLSLGWVSYFPNKVAADDELSVGESTFSPAPTGEYVADQVIVKFKPGVDTASEAQLNATLGTEVVYTSPYAGFKLLQVPEGKTVAEIVAAYSTQAIVEYAEPNYIDRITWTSPDDTYYSLQWHFTQINLEAAWALDTASPNYGGDPGVVVAIVDTGIAYEDYGGGAYLQAPDLANTNFTTGYDFVNTDDHPNDDENHGTHVCGTIAQSTNNNLGVAGIAFNTTIMPLKTLGVGGGSHAQFSDAYHYAADNGAEIINYSAGGSDSTTKSDAVIYARNAGVIIMAAMGNDGDTTNETQYPAAYNDYVVAVGTTRYDEARPAYGSYGSHMDIAAPGGDTSVNQNGDAYVDGVVQQTFKDPQVPGVFEYQFWQGTSMATPHVSGVAALVLAENPTWTAAQVRHALLTTATDIGDSGFDNIFGWGLLHAANAVGASLPPATSYSDEYTTPCNTFDDYDTENIVYMKSTGLLASYGYRMAYYDGGGTKRATEDASSDASGVFTTQHTFTLGVDVAGDWNVVVCDDAHTPPTDYSATWTYTITSDSFTVDNSAIPEFPTALTAIVSLSLCAGVYLWIRRKRALLVPA